MGNKHSCHCFRSCHKNPTRRARRTPAQDVERYEPSPEEPETDERANNLQHISDREKGTEEDILDPSVHPRTSTIFLTKSEALDMSQERRNHYAEHRQSTLNKKFSSCSTIFIDDSTVSQPNLKSTIRCVALAIYYHIKNRDSSRLMDIFDEKQYPLSKTPVPEDYDKHNPEHRHIYKFIRMLFNAAQLTAECAIVTLVYLERLLTYAEINITPSNWKRMILGAILLASKVWDDQAVWNVDYCQILRELTVEDMNELERQFLELLQFNINVPASVYAKYYFDLRELADTHELAFPLEPLSTERAMKLEVFSKPSDEKQRDFTAASHANLKRSRSADSIQVVPRFSNAIIS